ncbi:hypothetical protein CTT34_15860 [Vreelandella aquamarina]|uniref:Type I restriction modification DNA specificity domain-containing protein n=1 Tax=Vreelandella aquamarina TaxID=77097 RepID=A0A857GNX9_9GAMM|nr:hypothetical protein CTT34_15860 [Halomonas meridiana]
MGVSKQTSQIATVPLGSLANISAGGTPNRKKPNYWQKGGIPWVTTSEVDYSVITSTKEQISEEGLKNSAAKIFPKGTLLIALYGQGKTRGQVGILGLDAATNQACAAITPTADYDKKFLFYVLQSDYPRIRALSNSGGQENLSGELIREIRIPAIRLIEQRKIAHILQVWDEALEKLAVLRAAKEQRLGSLRATLLFGNLCTNGPRRQWTPTRLATVTHELTGRNGANGLGRDYVMGVTKAQGVVPMREQTIAGDISRYKRLPPRAFAYNPMRINVGSIAMNQRDEEVLVSPDYVVFACNADGLDPGYLDHLRKTSWWAHYINSGGSGSVRQRTYYADLAALKLPLPELDEQKAITEVLDTARGDLEATEREIKAVTRQKRGLMQKLLTGEWRVEMEE